MRSLLRSILILCCGLTSTLTMAGNEHYQVLIGEAVPKDKLWEFSTTHPCYTDVKAAAQGVCTVHQPGSPDVLLRFSEPEHLGTWRGGSCGYGKYAFICYGLGQGTLKKRFTISSDSHGCGADPIPIAASYCRITGGGVPDTQYPFTLRTVELRYGGRCGVNIYEVTCRDFPTREAATDSHNH